MNSESTGQQVLTHWLGNPDSGAGFVATALLFVSVFLATLAIGGLIRSSSYMRLRLARAKPTAQPKVSLRQNEGNSTLDRVLKRLEKHVVPANEKERTTIRRRLIHAGFMAPMAVRLYYAARILLAVSLPSVFLLLAPTLWPHLQARAVMLVALVLGAAGFYLPYRWLQSKIESRQVTLTDSFPDSLDMLVVCVGAGLGLDAALMRVSRQMALSHPVLARELGLITIELRAGKSRDESLQNFALRTGVQDISSFVTLLIQSDALGVSMSQTLRVQADEMRTKRMLRAEEQAHKLPVKLSIPLVLCVMPALFAAVLGPAIISIVRDVLPHLAR